MTLAARDEGRGPAVLLVHGFPLGKWMWEGQIAALRDRFRAIAPDLRGFGDSPLGDPPPASIDDHAAQLVALLREKGIERAAVVGFSMGGYVALALVERAPEVVAALVLASTRAAPDTGEARAGRTAMAEKVRAEGAAPVADAMVKKLFAPGTEQRRPELVADVRARIARVDPRAIEAALLAMRDRPDRRPLLARIAVPTFGIAGELDAITPPAEVGATVAAVPDGKLGIVKGAGHLANLENPDEFNKLLIEFLTEKLAGAAPPLALAAMKCRPCRGGTPPLRGEPLRALFERLGGGWRLAGEHHLEKEYRFKGFRPALEFVVRVGEIAEAEGHHPDIQLSWGKVKLTIFTHKIDGLTESDFILAAKADMAL